MTAIAKCPRCSQHGYLLQAWVPSAHPFDAVAGVQRLPVECCEHCYRDLQAGVVWPPAEIEILKDLGLDTSGLTVWENEHFLRLGRVYEDSNGRRWACVDWTHDPDLPDRNLFFLGVCIRDPDGQRIGEDGHAEWFDPSGVSANGSHLRLVKCVPHGPAFMPNTPCDPTRDQPKKSAQ